MSSHILLAKTGARISRTTVQRVTNLELQTTDEKVQATSLLLNDNDFLLEGNLILRIWLSSCQIEFD